MMIFILGTGRSGTHMIADLLDSHPRIYVSAEEQPIFDLVSDVSIWGKHDAIVDLVAALQDQAAAHPIYANKSHHAIWCAPALQSVFPDRARFIAIERNPHAVVASMLHHASVRSWSERFEQLPEPCPFLGLTSRKDYRKLDVVQRCALRWRAHHERLTHLEGLLDDLLVLRYEAVVSDPEGACRKLAAFVDLPNLFDASIPKPGSVARWTTELSAEQIWQVNGIIAPSVPTQRTGE